MMKRGRPVKVKELKKEGVKVKEATKLEEISNELVAGDRVETPDGEGNVLEVQGSLVKVVMGNGGVNNYNIIVLKKK